MWLETPVVEKGEDGKPDTWSRTQGKGTPQGGVISPLLSNLYLHWFDKQFHRNAGPAHGANARLVRYADDFVVLARYQADKLRNWIESTLEGWLGLQINRDKTRVVNLWQTGAKLDFLGYTFCHWADLKGRSWRYLHVGPSAKSLQREREKLYAMTDYRHCHQPLPLLLEQINRHRKGWRNYFSYGYPTRAFGKIDFYVRGRLVQHLRRRSQRPYRPPEKTSFYAHLYRMGLVRLKAGNAQLPAHACD